MTDRELLEKAAKAAGLPYTADNYASPEEDLGGWGMVESIGVFWNPLTDDGDALRLAVKLQLDIEFVNGDALVLSVAQGGGDPYADTRRAIVRAAAKIADK